MRSYLLFLVLLLLLSCTFSSRLYEFEVKAPVSYPVHNINTELNYTTIQEAINANETANGNTIQVDAGTYYEHLGIGKSITLLGENKSSTFIDGNGTGNVVDITANNVTMSGFTVRNGYIGIAIDVIVAETYDIITGNNILNNSVGINLHTAYNTTIIANTIENCSFRGVNLFASSNNTFFHNNFINNYLPVFNWGESGEWPNTWDNGNLSGGNFWSDYTGNDSDEDGFGESPYNVGPYLVGNLDHYPLMGTFQSFSIFGNVWDEIDIVSNSTIDIASYGQVDSASTPSWFIILNGFEGPNETAGFCRMTFPNNLLNASIYYVNVGEVGGFDHWIGKIISSNGTHTTLYFTYNLPLTESGIIVMPEFPSFLILPLFFITTVLAVLFFRKRRTKRLRVDEFKVDCSTRKTVHQAEFLSFNL